MIKTGKIAIIRILEGDSSMMMTAPPPDHDCNEEALSTCCGVPSHDFLDSMCSACNEFASFECGICEEPVDK